MNNRTPIKVAVAGFTSNSGKTTLLCDLLGGLSGWEAIKVTRGHYRSCGKDPHACCVSHLLSEEPVLRSERSETFAPGKDTGRYWDAGATNVHWAIVTDAQVERGIKLALERVKSPGVLIEGNSFLKYVDADFVVMAARADGTQIKPSARRVLSKISALYLFEGDGKINPAAREDFARWLEREGLSELLAHVPVYTRANLSQLIESIKTMHAPHENNRAVNCVHTF
jgi:molybdopterin-guanine dinucleotide biosynthesis protein